MMPGGLVGEGRGGAAVLLEISINKCDALDLQANPSKLIQAQCSYYIPEYNSCSSVVLRHIRYEVQSKERINCNCNSSPSGQPPHAATLPY